MQALSRKPLTTASGHTALRVLLVAGLIGCGLLQPGTTQGPPALNKELPHTSVSDMLARATKLSMLKWWLRPKDTINHRLKADIDEVSKQGAENAYAILPEFARPEELRKGRRGYRVYKLTDPMFGEPYMWGGFDDETQFMCKRNSSIALSAGSRPYKRKGHEVWQAAPDNYSYTTGVDCSGLVSLAWSLPRHYGTGAVAERGPYVLQAVSAAGPRQPSTNWYEALETGDAIEVPGHVVLFDHRVVTHIDGKDNQARKAKRLCIFEATGSGGVEHHATFVRDVSIYEGYIDRYERRTNPVVGETNDECDRNKDPNWPIADDLVSCAQKGFPLAGLPQQRHPAGYRPLARGGTPGTPRPAEAREVSCLEVPQTVSWAATKLGTVAIEQIPLKQLR